MLKKYEKIDQWLSGTIKNAYYFSSDTVLRDRDFTKGYSDAIAILRDGLEMNWTREEYLEWSRVWKSTYSKLSTECLASKRGRKTVGVPWSNAVSDRNYNNAVYLSGAAIRLLDMRWMSKILADQAFLEFKARKLEAA